MHTQLVFHLISHKQEHICYKRNDAANNLRDLKHDDKRGFAKHVHFITSCMPGLSYDEHETTADQTLPDLATYWAG